MTAKGAPTAIPVLSGQAAACAQQSRRDLAGGARCCQTACFWICTSYIATQFFSLRRDFFEHSQAEQLRSTQLVYAMVRSQIHARYANFQSALTMHIEPISVFLSARNNSVSFFGKKVQAESPDSNPLHEILKQQ